MCEDSGAAASVLMFPGRNARSETFLKVTGRIFRRPPGLAAAAAAARRFHLHSRPDALVLTAVLLQPNPARVWPLALPRLHGNLHSIHMLMSQRGRTQISRDLIAQKFACVLF